MKIFLVILSVIVMCKSFGTACHACFDGICFVKRKVFYGKQFSGQIAIDRMDNSLHLHYQDFKSTDYTVVLDLNNFYAKPKALPVAYSFARAINTETGEVFFSGVRGIYVYNSVTQKTRPFGYFNKTIWHMQYKGKLYFSEHTKEGIYFVENNRTEKIKALTDFIVDDFVIDKYEDIYFISDYILYRYRKGEKRPRIFSNVLYSLTTDKNDNVYLIETTSKTLFKMDYDRDRIKEVGIFQSGSVARAVFDKTNNLVYVDNIEDEIYQMRPNSMSCSVVKKRKKIGVKYGEILKVTESK